MGWPYFLVESDELWRAILNTVASGPIVLCITSVWHDGMVSQRADVITGKFTVLDS